MSSLLRRASLLACLVGCSPTPDARKWNVVVISIDTLRADHLGAWGETRPTSPRLDRLCAESVVFRDAISQAGVTAPSHMSLFTSLYPSEHGVRNSYQALKRATEAAARDELLSHLALSPRARTLAETLRAHGWRTAAFVGAGQMIGELGFARGFEVWDEELANGMNGNGEQFFDGSRAASWIDAHRADPFFLFLHTYAVHAPYLPPPPWNRAFAPDYAGDIPTDHATFYASTSAPDRYRAFWGNVDPRDPADVEELRALYAGDVRYADDAVGTMLGALERAGLMDRTIVVVLSDHGEEFQEHGAFEHPGDLYDELVHVPLIVRAPGFAPRTLDETVRLIDVMPTVLELANVAAPPELEGVSLVSAMRGGRIDPLPAFSEQRTDARAPDGSDRGSQRALRTADWTYLVETVGGRRTEALFDRRNDRDEQHDLAADPARAAVLAELRGRMQTHANACAATAARLGAGGAVEVDGAEAEALRALGYTR